MNIYQLIANLAKSNKYQNLLVAAKEINNIRIFKNSYNLSKLQEIFINYLYMFDTILKDIAIDNISKKTIEDNIYWESYMLWRKDNKFKKESNKDKKSKKLHLVAGSKINLPKRGN